MKGLILINAYSENEEYLYQPMRLKEELARLNVEADIRRNDLFPFAVSTRGLESRLDDYDFCIYLDKDKYILNALSKQGIPLFNAYEPIMVCDDKMLTYLALTDYGIPMPKTLPGLLCYSDEEIIKSETVRAVESELSYPLVFKKSYGSLGKDVHLINDRNELIAIMDEFKCSPHLFQEFIESSRGKDVRVMVVGGEAVGGMLRTSNTDFRSNLGAGACGKPYEISKSLAELSQKIATVLKLDYCGIDFLFGKDDTMLVCEVNSNAYFSGFEKVTGINVAALYARYIVKKFQSC